MPTSLASLSALDLALITALAALSLTSILLFQSSKNSIHKAKEDNELSLKALKEQNQSINERLEAAQRETKEAREEAELTLLQLHQVQEELEHYFLDSRSKDEFLEQYNQQANDMKRMIATLNRLRPEA